MDDALWLENFYKKYAIYDSLKFSVNENRLGEKLHPLYTATQKIIDELVTKGSKRIAIVLPDEECNILPLIIAKYFSCVQNEPDYAGSVLDEILPGQHLRLFKAVVEFIGLDKELNKIKFKVERKNPMTFTCPVNGIHFMLEKTDGAISSCKVWREAEAKAEELLNSSDKLIQDLKAKRTAINKTLTLLTPKNDFYDNLESLYVNKYAVTDTLAYGEIDVSLETSYKLRNTGKLSCLPGISITNDLDDILCLAEDESKLSQIYAVYSVQEKFDEIVENIDVLKEILKLNVPFITFIPESKFDQAQVILSLNFDLWHWKPSTVKLVACDRRIKSGEKFFESLTSKVVNAATASFKCTSVRNLNLKEALCFVYRLSKEAVDCSAEINKFVRNVWGLQNKLAMLICDFVEVVETNLLKNIQDLNSEWTSLGKMYVGQPIYELVKQIFEKWHAFVLGGEHKSQYLLKLLKSITGNCKVIILVNDGYPFFAETRIFVESYSGTSNVKLMRLSNFYADLDKLGDVDYLIVTWFDKNEYIRIKQTYCYKNLCYVLYDFESRWRQGFISMLDEKLPHESVLATAKKLNINLDYINSIPFDAVQEEKEDDEGETKNQGYKEINDYNVQSKILTATIKRSSPSSRNSTDSVEIIPVIFDGDKVGYFYPEHDIIDVTALSKGMSGRAYKKEAYRLRKDDKILIRQSGKDIIRERADLLMSKHSDCDRDLVEVWRELLAQLAYNKTIVSLRDALNSCRARCSFQQVRGWLFNDTIIPRDKNALIAIGRVAEKSENEELRRLGSDYLQCVDKIFDMGKSIQGYHLSAGRWLTSEIKNKADDIRRIIGSSTHAGKIEGIGEINILTVQEVLGKEFVPRTKLNRIEEL